MPQTLFHSTQALFYPWIDIRDEAWLKTSLLYWDSVRTIVPESIREPYTTETGRALEAADYLVPLRVESGMEEIEALAGEVLRYLGTDEGVRMLTQQGRLCQAEIHVDSLPSGLSELVELDPMKLPYAIRDLLRSQQRGASGRQGSLAVDQGFADYYMTLLASRLSERIGASLATALPAADRLAMSARLDAQVAGLLPWGDINRRRDWREDELRARRRTMPVRLAPALLAHLAIEKIGLDPATPIDRLLKFREKYADELASFRSAMQRLAGAADDEISMEALRRRVSMIYERDVAPATTALKKAMSGKRIKWLGEGLLKLTFMSVGATSMLVTAGLEIPTALLVGAGISLTVSGALYKADKEKSLRAAPFTYLLAMRSELV